MLCVLCSVVVCRCWLSFGVSCFVVCWLMSVLLRYLSFCRLCLTIVFVLRYMLSIACCLVCVFFFLGGGAVCCVVRCMLVVVYSVVLVVCVFVDCWLLVVDCTWFGYVVC